MDFLNSTLKNLYSRCFCTSFQLEEKRQLEKNWQICAIFSISIIKYLLNTYCAPRKISEMWCGGDTLRWTRPFFTTDAYTVTGDRGAKAQRQQDRQTHTHRKEDMTRLYLAIQPENARVRKSMIKVNWLHHRRLFWGQRTWSLSRIGRDRETRVVYKAIQTGSSKSAALGNSPRSKKKQNTCTPTAAAALFTVARTWEQPRRPSRDDWIEKMRYIHTQWNITQP